MKTMTSIRAFFPLLAVAACRCALAAAEAPITVDTRNLLVTVDPTACRWSAQVKGRRCG